MKCDIVIPIWNQLESTKECMDNLIKNTHYPYRLILVDNGSDDDTRLYLEGLKADRFLDVKLICNDKNLGFVKAVNQGLRASDAPYVCILNNDTIPAPGWLEKMIRFADLHKEAGLLNPQCAGHGNAGHGNAAINEHARILEKNEDKYMEMNQCFGYCMLIKRELIDKIGYLDEAFGIGGYDDTDYSMRAHKAGYACVNVHSSYVYHKQHMSFNAMGDREKLVSLGQAAYFKKWPRHLRIGIAFSLKDDAPDQDLENLFRGVLFLAREWCWVNFWIFGDIEKSKARISKISQKIAMPLHQNIKYNFLPSRFKKMQLLIRLAERAFGTKRRKKYDIFFANDRGTLSFLNSFFFLHSTRIAAFDPGHDMVKDLDTVISKLRGG